MPDANTPEGFAKIRSLHAAGELLGTEVGKLIGQTQYCLGYHIRHFLQSEHQPVALVSPNIETAEKVFEQNAAIGLHTVNHVIDSLYPFQPEKGNGMAILVRISYSMKPEQSADLFEELEPNPEDQDIAQSVLKGWDFRSIRMSAAPVTGLIRLADGFGLAESAFAQMGDPARGTAAFYNAFLPGTHRVCVQLNIPPSILAYRALMAAVYQLGTYSSRFGSECLVVVLRQADPLGFATGVTTITDETVCGTAFSELLKTLARQNTGLSMKQVLDQRPDGYYDLLHYKGLHFNPGEHRNLEIPEAVGKVLEAQLPSVPKEQRAQLAFFDPPHFRQTVTGFLRLCALFCEERFEGTDLQFGLVLGNPFLMKFWPGEMPVPICSEDDGRYRFFDSPDVPKQIHLLENPAERCLVVPFQSTAGYSMPLAAYVVELTDFQEALAAKLGAWTSTLAPYIYFTKRYPWAIGAVVGPHSEMRIFSGGRLVVYRDGKGWRILKDPVELIEHRCTSYFSEVGASVESHKAVMRALAEVALQVGPIARPGSHGGLLVYSPLETDDPLWNDPDQFEQLVSAEPQRLDRGGKWITGLELLDPTGRLDDTVAHLLVRASVLDGAIVLGGTRGAIKSFATRLNFGRSHGTATAVAGGTKRRTAEAFVEYFSEKKRGALAIAVSADGPIRLTFYCPTRQEAVTYDLFSL